jgi:hypothetical protein
LLITGRRNRGIARALGEESYAENGLSGGMLPYSRIRVRLDRFILSTAISTWL